MDRYLPVLGAGVAFYLVYFTAKLLLSFARNMRQARALGCKPALARRSKTPWGIDHMLEVAKADKENSVPPHFMKVYEQVGSTTWTESMLNSTVVMTVDPKNVQAVLATQFHDFELGPQRRDNFAAMLGIGIFTADGKVWEHSRAMLRPQFSRDQIADLELEERHVKDLQECLPVDASGWTNEVDLSPMFFRLTLDSATEFLFGEGVHSQQAHVANSPAKPTGSYNWKNLARSFDRGTLALATRVRLGDLYWMYSPQTFRDDCTEVQRFADSFISKTLANSKNRVEEEGKKARYIFLEELAKKTQDPVELRSQLLNILLAGRDTTAGLLGWAFWCLARDPKVYEKLRASILDSFGSSHEGITYVGLKSCSYLQWVLQETLRLYPSVPINSRFATKNTSLPRGGGLDGNSPIFVKKGQEVGYFVYVMHRRKDLWGPNADEFDPGRWANRKHGWEYLPFNGGPRVCLGQQFALTEAGYVLARMVQRFDKIQNCDANNTPQHLYSLTIAPTQVVLKLHEATAA